MNEPLGKHAGPGDENPGPEGAEGEPVGDEENETDPAAVTVRGLPPAEPLSPDANPIDPRVF